METETMHIALSPSLVLTTDHPASSYGRPMLIVNPKIEPQTTYGPADVFTYDQKTWPAAMHVKRFAAIHKEDQAIQEAAKAFCSQWPEGPQVQ